MSIRDYARQRVPEGTGVVMKLLSLYILPGLVIVSQLIAVWFSAGAGIFPGADALMTIVTTCSQIIAGLYGITLAGYTFFLSRIDALSASDTTLDYVVGSIKNRFKHLIWYITFNVLVTLLISIVLMYAPVPEGETAGFLYRLFCNEFVLFVIYSVGLILYYSVLVVDPNCVEKEAARLKKKLGGKHFAPGSVTDFLILYDRIQTACAGIIPEAALSQLRENKGNRFALLLELLEAQNPRLRPLIPELRRIHRYYECVINCTPFSVSQNMVGEAQKILAVLQTLDNNLKHRG